MAILVYGDGRDLIKFGVSYQENANSQGGLFPVTGTRLCSRKLIANCSSRLDSAASTHTHTSVCLPLCVYMPEPLGGLK